MIAPTRLEHAGEIRIETKYRSELLGRHDTQETNTLQQGHIQRSKGKRWGKGSNTDMSRYRDSDDGTDKNKAGCITT